MYELKDAALFFAQQRQQELRREAEAARLARRDPGHAQPQAEPAFRILRPRRIAVAGQR